MRQAPMEMSQRRTAGGSSGYSFGACLGFRCTVFGGEQIAIRSGNDRATLQPQQVNHVLVFPLGIVRSLIRNYRFEFHERAELFHGVEVDSGRPEQENLPALSDTHPYRYRLLQHRDQRRALLHGQRQDAVGAPAGANQIPTPVPNQLSPSTVSGCPDRSQLQPPLWRNEIDILLMLPVPRYQLPRRQDIPDRRRRHFDLQPRFRAVGAETSCISRDISWEPPPNAVHYRRTVRRYGGVPTPMVGMPNYLAFIRRR